MKTDQSNRLVFVGILCGMLALGSIWFGAALHPMDWNKITPKIAAGRFLILAGPLVAAFWFADELRKHSGRPKTFPFYIVAGLLWIGFIILPVIFLLLYGAMLR